MTAEITAFAMQKGKTLGQTEPYAWKRTEMWDEPSTVVFRLTLAFSFASILPRPLEGMVTSTDGDMDVAEGKREVTVIKDMNRLV
mmetsp:Transcript_22231/g.27476  ORF Transcript_22231/g.27476 Transcript_22231/m.27476 type:complete len:85 (+) Transcript_22231:1298-1552(+)